MPPDLDFYKISHNYVNIVQPSSIAPQRQRSKSALRCGAGDHFHSSITFFSLPWSNPPFSNPHGSSRLKGDTLDQRQVSENSDSFVHVRNNERWQAITFRLVTWSFTSGLPAEINLETEEEKEKEEEEVGVEGVKKSSKMPSLTTRKRDGQPERCFLLSSRGRRKLSASLCAFT